MHRALKLGLAGLLMAGPALQAQKRLPVAATGSRDSSANLEIDPRPIQDDEEGLSKVGRVVSFALVGGLAGGLIAYYTAPSNPTCFGCPTNAPEGRVIKGALIGGTGGLALGLIVVLGESKPKLSLR